MDDIKHAAEFLKVKGCTKVGVIGFCMGGALAIASSAKAPELIDAGICFYGIPPAQLADPATIKIPVQSHFGDKEHSPGFSDIEAAVALREKMKSAGLAVVETRHHDEVYKEQDGREGAVQEFHRYVNGDHGKLTLFHPTSLLITPLSLQH